jgi:predicted nucleic acid-binding protein
MATTIEPGDEVFLDTSDALALSAPADQFHGRALQLADEMEAARTRLVTTRAVLLEIGNALSRQRYRAAAIRLLQAIEVDPNVKVLSLSEELYAKALQLYCSRQDKEWGLIDCASFVVMFERSITKALTADEHFQQCGFRALLREGNGGPPA